MFWNVIYDFKQPLLQASMSHASSEIIATCWFAAQETCLISINVLSKYIFLMHIILLCTYTFFQDSYTVPLTSIQCWHVHCEECWLRTLVRRTFIILYLTKDVQHSHVTSTSEPCMLLSVVFDSQIIFLAGSKETVSTVQHYHLTWGPETSVFVKSYSCPVICLFALYTNGSF